MAKWEWVDWLLYWLLEGPIVSFEWDLGNVAKSEVKHGVTPTEAESVFKSRLALPLGKQIEPKTHENRFGIIGPGDRGRLLQVAFVFRKSRIRIISARPAHRKEIRQYEETLRKISESL